MGTEFSVPCPRPRSMSQWKSAREVKDNYTRISSRERVIAASDDGEAVRAAVRKRLNDIYPKLEGVPAVIKKVLPTLAVGTPMIMAGRPDDRS